MTVISHILYLSQSHNEKKKKDNYVGEQFCFINLFQRLSFEEKYYNSHWIYKI